MLNLHSTSRTFRFYLLPAFSLQSFSSAIEALRLANEVLGRKVYSWEIISDSGEPVLSSCGLSICADLSLSIARDRDRRSISPPAVVVAGGRNTPNRHKQLDGWLRECRNRGTWLVGMGGGTTVLAGAGLAEGRRCAVHWEQFPMFCERFPTVKAVQTTFEQDGYLSTCAGGDAPFDMFLGWVHHDHGSTVVNRICQQAIVCRIRSAGDRQRLPLHSRMRVNHRAVLRIVDIMESNIAEPMDVEKLAASASLSRRQVERLFRNELGYSPSRYYMELRLERAHLLLISTRLPIIEVAVSCGFVSASHFSKTYRDVYGCSPHQSRLPIFQHKEENRNFISENRVTTRAQASYRETA
ncbi:GlxA family transcriptional regulator [Mesorhizobium sp. M4B.F.Ca.ET.190.01.1.1]|uniref:GlxA family transcriptional regulator n=1 Tax=unclassified Mesorhizobium TaxID=325217 RepID=UPI001091D51B|nr:MULTISPECIES: GlxA family transcriptional regulator [unclassified Mesorhizobium]TGR15157.1 GlxA family transcriptional regulator [Mesorhizobium sp. M4B.F.Ca.ET.200.01.1.1]TGS23031.1 GlxA family transcriptional regulator [Mesorhizobium sp. M4B.F.Ca.ET.190.01.1.1]TGT33866.1 GlxA family transcriptional regulator [Mesorhizobium sp. M4B.F.Ca.ET.172.01.1.1]